MSSAGSAARVAAAPRTLQPVGDRQIDAASARVRVVQAATVTAVPGRASRQRPSAPSKAAIEATGTATAARQDGPLALTSKLTTTVPGRVAKIRSDGYAAAPAGAPLAVQQAIWAGNQLIGRPYLYGGGHGSFVSDGYDCSGSVSFALHGGHLLSAPLDSDELLGWGQPGRGAWLTVYTQAGHAFLEIAGIRLDTSSAGDPGGLDGPRWRPLLASTAAYVARHPAGY